MAPGSAAATSARRAGSPTATHARAELLGLGDQRLDGRADAEADDLVARGLGPHDVERLRPDRTGRAGDGDADRSGRAGPGLEPQRHVVRHGQDEQEGVEAVEHAAVPAHQGAEVLHVEVALEHALGEVAERGEHRDHGGQDQQVARRPRVAALGQADDEQHEERQQRCRRSDPRPSCPG